MRFSVIGLVMVAIAGVGIVGLSKITPTEFLPEDDQGALFVVVQTPGGAAVARTSEVIRQAEDILREEEAVADYTSVIGLNFIDNYSQPNAAFMVVTLKPFEERKDRSLGAPAYGPTWCQVPADHRRNRGPPFAAANSRPRYRRRIYLRAAGPARRRPQGTGRGLARPHRRRQSGPAVDARVQHVLATNPSIYLDIDRNKVQVLGVQLNDVFQALQASLGGFYVNDLNLFGRRWQVNIQAKAPTAGRSTTSIASMCATPTAR